MFFTLRALLSSRSANCSRMPFTLYESSKTIEKSPLIIMHGLFGSKNNWNSISKALQKQLNRNILTVDARNHGDSLHTDEFSYELMVDDLICFCEEHKIKSACAMGHSMGGRTMMLFALNHPEKVEKLIVVDISPYPSSKRIYDMKSYFDILKSVKLSKDLTLPIGRKEADKYLSSYIQNKDVRQFLLTNLIKMDDGNFGWKVNLDALSSKFNIITNFPDVKGLSYKKPVLFIGGKKSDYLKPEDESSILNIFPAAKFVYLDCGHWVHAEKPNEFLPLVLEFIGRS